MLKTDFSTAKLYIRGSGTGLDIPETESLTVGDLLSALPVMCAFIAATVSSMILVVHAVGHEVANTLFFPREWMTDGGKMVFLVSIVSLVASVWFSHYVSDRTRRVYLAVESGNDRLLPDVVRVVTEAECGTFRLGLMNDAPGAYRGLLSVSVPTNKPEMVKPVVDRLRHVGLMVSKADEMPFARQFV